MLCNALCVHKKAVDTMLQCTFVHFYRLMLGIICRLCLLFNNVFKYFIMNETNFSHLSNLIKLTVLAVSIGFYGQFCLLEYSKELYP